MQDNDHPPRGAADDETFEAMRRVADYARSLELYGVLILSPVCPHCGAIHEFCVISDLKEGEEVDIASRGGVVAKLLRDHAELIESATPERFETAPANRKH